MTYHPESAAITPRSNTTPQPRLFDEVRRRLRLKHYSLSTERIYLQWMRRFILASGRRHPRDRGGAEVERFLSTLGNFRVRFIFSEYSCRRRLRAPVCSGPRGKGGAGIICLNPPRPAFQIVQSSTCNPAILPKARSFVTSAAPTSEACAAISRSSGPSDLPCRSMPARIVA